MLLIATLFLVTPLEEADTEFPWNSGVCNIAACHLWCIMDMVLAMGEVCHIEPKAARTSVSIEIRSE